MISVPPPHLDTIRSELESITSSIDVVRGFAEAGLAVHGDTTRLVVGVCIAVGAAL